VDRHSKIANNPDLGHTPNFHEKFTLLKKYKFRNASPLMYHLIMASPKNIQFLSSDFISKLFKEISRTNPSSFESAFDFAKTLQIESSKDQINEVFLIFRAA
jgi:hypothetical protein